MTIARNRQICLEETSFYHCTSRCVRRAFLCGFDPLSGNSFEHRRGWIESRLLQLSKAFCIDLVSYAVMSNHYHVILKVDTKTEGLLTDREIVDRWSLLYKLRPLLAKFKIGAELSNVEMSLLTADIRVIRTSLTSISKYMGYLNERIARKANLEDECKGRFWEGRFHSQALLDDTALLQCMTYVDLNPVRAGIASTPEDSLYTSVGQRLKSSDHGMLPFDDCAHSNKPYFDPGSHLPITFPEYLELLDWTGRIIRDGKNGHILEKFPPIFGRLEKGPKKWIYGMTRKSRWRPKALGSPERIKSYCHSIGQCWMWNFPEQTTA